MSDLLEFQSRYYAFRERAPNRSPFLHEEEGHVSLYFDFTAIQSSMRKDNPNELVVDYTQTMMGFLLFQPQPERIAMIGLGGGSLAKYCHEFLPQAHFRAVEIHPDVIALRNEFAIPPDGDRFQVIHADGADYVRSAAEPVDVLLIDGFDMEGQPRQLCSAGFYDHCYAKLREGGVMVVNLWGGDGKHGLYASRIRDSFEGNAVVVDTQESGNKVAFAYKGFDFPPSLATLNERVRKLGAAHPVSLHATAQRVLRQLRKRPSLPGIV